MLADFRDLSPNRRTPLLSEAVWATGLEEHLTRPIGALSKGFRQRGGLAQAILDQPPPRGWQLRRAARDLRGNSYIIEPSGGTR